MAFDISTAKFDDGQAPKTGFDLSTAKFDDDQSPVQPSTGLPDAMPEEKGGLFKGETYDAIKKYYPPAGVIGGMVNAVTGDGVEGLKEAFGNSPGAMVAEAGASLGSGIGSMIGGGVAGGATALVNGPEAGADTVKSTMEAGTYVPRGEGAQNALGRLEYAGKAIHWLENFTGAGVEEIARGFGVEPGSNAAGAAYAAGATFPTALSFMVPGAAASKPAAAASKAAAVESQIPRMIDSVKRAESAAPASSKRQAAMQELAVKSEPQADIARAFEESGIPAGSVPAEVLAGNQEFRQLAGAARSVVAGPAKIQYRSFLNEVSARVDDMAAKAEATSPDIINAEVSGLLTKNIDDATKASRQLWDDAERSIAPNQAVDTSAMANKLLARLDEVGGDVAELSPLEKRLTGRFLQKTEEGAFIPKETPKTWSSVSGLRQELNAARGGKGGFKDSAGYELDTYANLVSEMQGKAAEALGAGDKFKAAMESTGVKKRAQETAQTVLGKNLDKSFTIALDSKGGALTKGRVSEFEKVVESLPTVEAKREAVTSFVFGKIINSKNLESRLDVANFNNFYNQINANPQAKAALYKHLTPESRKAVDNIGKMTGAIKRANEDFIPTGAINSAKEGWKLADSLVGRLGKIVLATKIPGSGQLVDAFAGKALKKSSRKVEDAASDLMASSEFQGYVTKTMADPAGAAAKSAEMSLSKSSAWRKLYAALPKAEREVINNAGITSWLQSVDNKNEGGAAE